VTGGAVLAAYMLLVCLGTGMATGQFAGARGWFPGGDKPKPKPEPQPEEGK
jgi:hypothetical protein